MKLAVACTVAVDDDIVARHPILTFDGQMGGVAVLQVGNQDSVHRRIGFPE